MNINGKPVSPDALNNLELFADIPEEELTEETFEYDTVSDDEVYTILKAANISGNIPLRYSNCRLSDYKYSFANDLWDFIKNPRDRVLLLSSSVGCGKTTILSAIMHERAILGLSAGLYFNDLTLSSMLRTCRSFSAKESEYDLIQRLATVDFLAIDEFGVDKNLDEESEFISTVLRLRYDNNLPTAIATNLTIARFKISICGISTQDKSVEELKELMPKLEANHPTLNRLISILTPIYIRGTSNRGKAC